MSSDKEYNVLYYKHTAIWPSLVEMSQNDILIFYAEPNQTWTKCVHYHGAKNTKYKCTCTCTYSSQS